jgi:hypothetical protein
MPSESHYHKSENLMYLRYTGNLTGDEFHRSFLGERAFFDGMTGLVGMLVVLSEIKGVPSGVLDIARHLQFARYRPLLIVIVGGHLFARTIAKTFARITGHTMVFFDDFESADQYMRAKVAEAQHQAT